MPDFPSRLRSLRHEARLTQKQLANAVGIGVTTVGGYERSEVDPTLMMICSLADYFHVSADYLLGRSEKR